ncbi:MAG TPA: NADH-quinone oxidoreductase subunit C [Vicinamibacterales bacterium]|jgi:NADH-quinone oxidoreductase subunit C
MDATSLVSALRESVPAAEIESVPTVDLHTTLYVSRDHFTDVARALRERPDLRFDLLAELTAADLWPHEPRFELVYVFVSLEHRLRLRVKVRLHGNDAHIATMSGAWPAANWLEREVWDLFGIEFDGHPDPRRLLMPEDWTGFPLRKDYPVQIRKTPTAAEPLQMTEEEFRANVMKDRLTRQ